MKRLLVHSSFVLLSMVFAGAIVAAQQTAPPPAQAKPEEKKEAPSIAGKWNLSVETPSGNRDSLLDLKIDGKKVTGTMASDMGETAVAGEYADGKLTFTINLDIQGQQISLAFAGAMKADGTLAGNIDFQGTQMPWVASRAK